MAPDFTLTANTLPAAAILLDGKGRMLGVNDLFVSLSGYTKEELYGVSGFDLVPLADHFLVKRFYELVAAKRVSGFYTMIRIRNKAGHILNLTISTANHLFNKQLRYFLILANDSTQKMRLQDQETAQAIVAARENEKHTMAAELHDNINQLLTASMMFIESAISRQPLTDPALARSKEFLNEAVDEIRMLSSALSGSNIKNLALGEALRNLTDSLLAGKSIQVITSVDETMARQLMPQQKLQVYRIVQEQFTNICRHARASRVTVSLANVSGFVELVIEDNGIGFDPKTGRSGMGLSNIAHRTKLLNGNFQINSAPGEGSIVKLRFPLHTFSES